MSKKAIFVHLYYKHLYDDMVSRLKQVPFGYVLYINLVEGASACCKNILQAEFPKSIINVIPNQGMDPGGQLRMLDYWLKYGNNEEFISFIHTKKNDELRNLFSSIINSRASMAIDAFNDPTVGMVGVKEWNLHPGTLYGKPIHYCDYYCNLLKLNNFETNRFGFIGGTMFWVRSSIYKKVFTNVDIIKLVEELVPYETGGKTHALERIFGYIVLSENYKIAGV